ncbi:hypothetical protein GA0111570_109118 [Raineyella antarctica]|uniref:von Willebrand factor type A domain-containing protein n=1 Tax=Raineyella antarctica TaxID=1577474 RepID=A0A1G6HG11_9ACTN|nr:hypothetical protein [Raineyella antarctica]SDB93189.1 hypothetical protein GA0111570_109118 [Raineyella antarctica]
MTDNSLTYIAAVLDRSGSMQSMAHAVTQGFDDFIAEQRGVPGRCLVSLAQFDNEYQEVFRDLPVDQVPPLDLVPRGTTALYDAIGRTVTTVGERLAALPEDQRPGSVIVPIMTDGYENASTEWTAAGIKDLITQQESQYSWVFLFMGTNQDAVEEGAKMGVRRERSITFDNDRSAEAYRATSQVVAGMRSAVMTGSPMAAPAYSADHRVRASRRARKQMEAGEQEV